MSDTYLGSNKMNQKSGDQKRKRRTRNHQDGRNYSCSCGKSYLSYPALYTHIKTKHNGKQQYNIQSQKDDASSPEANVQQQIAQNIQKPQQQNFVDQFKKIINKIFPFTRGQNDKNLKEQTQQQKDWIKMVKSYWNKHKKQEQTHQNDTYSTSIDYIFGKFLNDFQNDFSKNAIKFMNVFVTCLRKAINQLKDENYCKNTSGSALPHMMNDVFYEIFNKYPSDHFFKKHPTIICRTIMFFCKWMFNQRFTNASMKYNTL